jgi:hypothetical protein
MSWVISAVEVPRDEVDARFQEVKDEQQQHQPDGQWGEGVEEQMTAALEALNTMLAVVDAETVNFNVAGHAKGTYEGDNDTVSVNVSGVNAPPEGQPG